MGNQTKPRKWEKVYIFISSTFNDMHAERDYLVKNVFPELSEWCERRKLRMVDIDLRWGVTEADATQNKNVVNVCLNRIDECRPFFLCFLGQRYGWVPERKDVSPETFEKFPGLEETVNNGASVTELEILHSLVSPFHSSHTIENKEYHPSEFAFFYFRDEAYIKELPKDLPYLRKIYSDLEEEDERTRNALQGKRAALKKRIVDTQRPCHIYQARWSKAHMTPEIAMPLQCPATIEENQKRWRRDWLKYADVHVVNLDAEEEPAEALKAREFNDRLSTGRMIEFRSENQELRDIVVEELKAAIQARFPHHIESEDPDELQREIDQQEEFVFINSEGFIKRTGDFDELSEYIESSSNKLFVLTAEAGMGKSTLLANWVDVYRTEIQDESTHSIHFRFIGASDGSTTVYSLLRLLLKEIKEVSGKLAVEIPDDPQKLRRDLPDLLKTIGKNGKTVIVLDALNQLETGLSDLTWLPRSLPEGIKLIVSFKREEGDAENLYKSFAKDERVHLVEVKPFEDRMDRKRLIDAYLSQFLKELDERHIESLIDSEAARNPLYLKVVLSELRVFGAFANLGEKIRTEFGETPLSAFEAVLQRLEQDPAYSPIDPQKAVSLIFGLTANARRGLSAEELISLLIQALDMENNEANRASASETIYLYLRQLRSFLAHRDGRYDFFYESFKQAALKKYTSEVEQFPKRKVQSWHKLLADYFYGLTLPNNRKAAELPFHLVHAQEWHRLEQTLCDLDFIQAKCSAGMTYDLVNDFNATFAVIPDNAENIRKEKERHARLDKYAKDLVLYSKGKINELEVPESIIPWSEKKINVEIAHIKTNPRRADRLKDFYNFLGHEAFNLQTHAKEIPHLATQQAWNYSDSGFVGEAAGKKPNEVLNRLLLRTAPTRPYWNPLPQALKKFEGHRALKKFEGHAAFNVTAVSITPDGKTVISSYYDGCILWDLESGIPLKALKGHLKSVGHLKPVVAMAITSDGKMALSCSEDTSILWDLESGMPRKTLNTYRAVAVAITADGKMAFSGSLDKTCILWDLESGQPLKTLKVHTSPVTSVAITADGKMALSGSEDKTCILWDLESGMPSKTLKGHTDRVEAVDITPDGKMALSSSVDRTCILWDLESGQPLKTFKGYIGYVEAVAITPDGKMALLGSSDNTCILWDLEGDKTLKTLKGHTGYVKAVAIAPDGKIAFSGSYDNTCILWDLECGLPSKTLKGHTIYVKAVAITPDGKMALSCSLDKTCILWDLGSGQPLKTLKVHTSQVTSVAIMPDGKMAFSGSGKSLGEGDNTCILWDLGSGQPLKTLKGHTNDVGTVAITPDGKMALSGSDDNTCILWDLESGMSHKTLKGHTDKVKAVAIAPDGKIALSGSIDNSIDKTCILWDLESGQPLKTLRGHGYYSVIAIAITPDGKMALSGSSDKTCILWDLRSGMPLRTLKGHTDKVEAVAIAPDGKMALSGSEDKTCIHWDLESGKKLAQFFAKSAISAIALSPQGIFGGNTSGDTFILHAHRELLCPGIGIITARKIWNFEFKQYQPISADCPFCGNPFSPPKLVLDTIEEITKNAGLLPEQSPCLELPDEAWEEPDLLSECPQCGEDLKFNPFIVDNKHYYIDSHKQTYGNFRKPKRKLGENISKINPSEPCPCQSGKKYKKCCGRDKK